MGYHAKYPSHLDHISSFNRHFTGKPTVETKQNAQLLEAGWSKLARGKLDVVLLEIQHDPFDTLYVLRVLLVVSFISQLYLFCVLVSI